MKLKIFISVSVFAVFLTACSNNQLKHDASGTFEADEVMVSSEESGKLISFNIQEGDILKKDSVIAEIDPLQLSLQQQQVEAHIQSLSQKTLDVQPQIKLLKDQIAVQQTQLANLQQEKKRVENLLKADAATSKQLDDINYQIESVQKQIAVNNQQIAVFINNTETQNRSILSEAPSLEKQAAQFKDRARRTHVVNPINGTVLTKYAMEGEVTSAGKGLYKIADLSSILLRAYITGTQLTEVKIGQTVKVFIDNGKDNYKEYSGTITWVADKAEFTPKTIQTKDERANLVYAIKIKVKNDGYLKIGMYGEVQFTPNP